MKSQELDKIRLGVSTCLLGENVRFDGGHKKDNYLTVTLAPFVEWIPVCPEVEMGMSIPREPIRLVGKPAAPRLVSIKTNVDYTSAMLEFSRAKVARLKKLDLDGYILKKNSPSCGMERVRVYGANHSPTRSGTGFYAGVLLQEMPLLPVEEEGRLNDPGLRANFIVRVFCHQRWRRLLSRRFRLGNLLEFHARHKFLLMAHSEKHLRELGKLVAAAKSLKPKELIATYAALFFTALRHHATTRRHTNVLQHIAGCFKKNLDARDRQELQSVISDYRNGLLPLIVPITLIKHHLNRFELQYIQDQVYLSPHPQELTLLNHV